MKFKRIKPNTYIKLATSSSLDYLLDIKKIPDKYNWRNTNMLTKGERGEKYGKK